VRKLLHPFVFLVQVLILRDVMLVQVVDVYANEEQLLKTVPNDGLLL
jgi:hypothetical protein